MMSHVIFKWAAGARLITLTVWGFLVFVGSSVPSFANTVEEWHEMVFACEAVIVEQHFAPLSKYETAPFNAGFPGVREYAVYHPEKRIVAIARLEDDVWVNCRVRNFDDVPASRLELVAEWEDGFELAFPRNQYDWGWSAIGQSRAAIRCMPESHAILILPTFSPNKFRIVVERDVSNRWDGCASSET